MNHSCFASQSPPLVEIEFSPQLAVTNIHLSASTSTSGFSCIWPSSFEPGQPLRLKMSTLDQEIATDALVEQCTASDAGFVLKLAIRDQEQEYQFRMLLQLSHIHHYHQQLQHQGRRMSLNEAAKEWIGSFAGSFPSINSIA